MAAELAREIILQSKPPDRSSPVCISIRSTSSVGYHQLSITAPIIDGMLIVRIEFNVAGGYALQYDARSNLEGAARGVEGFVHHNIGFKNALASMYVFDKNGYQSRELSRWSFKDLNEVTVMEKMQSILKTLLAV